MSLENPIVISTYPVMECSIWWMSVSTPHPKLSDSHFGGFRDYPHTSSYEILNFVDSVTTPHPQVMEFSFFWIA